HPHRDRSAIDVAEGVIRAARSARQGGLALTAVELMRRVQLRNDFGAVARAHPVDRALEVSRALTVDDVVHAAEAAANDGRSLLVVGPQGQGKYWLFVQVSEKLSGEGCLVEAHYYFFGAPDDVLLPRVL